MSFGYDYSYRSRAWRSDGCVPPFAAAITLLAGKAESGLWDGRPAIGTATVIVANASQSCPKP